MSSYESYTFRLFKKTPSFFDGFFSVIDMSPTVNRYKVNKEGKEADLKSLQADWFAVGEDLKSVIDAHGTGQSK